MDDIEAGRLAALYDDADPEEVLAWAFDHFDPQRLVLVNSFQIDGMVLLDMAHRLNPSVRVVTVDTGRLPQETYDLMETVRERYGVTVEVLVPEPSTVEAMVRRHGPNLFYRSLDLRLLCCEVRKVEPLKRLLRTVDAWVTGLRRSQWATRANIRKIELDHDHGGIVKLNPLADWSEEEVWDYARRHQVPVHPLYARGYKSIGCAPCTRPVAPGEPDRAGRWWWEKDGPKECGMHCAIFTGGFEHELEAILHEAGRKE